MMGSEIILASASPRRADLLQQIGLPFRLHPSTLDENGAFSGSSDEAPESRACRLARAKADQVAAWLRRGLVIGADTIVVCDGIAYGKPHTPDEACAILLHLAGRSHQVITGVAVVDGATRRAEVASMMTVVRMRSFDAAEASAYVATGEPLGKAGAYAIQGRGALLVEGIEGDYSNVVGLPLPMLAMLLRRFGIDVWEQARA